MDSDFGKRIRWAADLDLAAEFVRSLEKILGDPEELQRVVDMKPEFRGDWARSARHVAEFRCSKPAARMRDEIRADIEQFYFGEPEDDDFR